MSRPNEYIMALGDVKDNGRIVVKTTIGDTLALTKIKIVRVDEVENNESKYEISGTLEEPKVFNVVHRDKNQKEYYFFIKNETEVTFFPDFN